MTRFESTAPAVPPIVVIDTLPDAALLYGSGWAVVAVDVARATTTVVTALETGRRCFPASSVWAARIRATWLRIAWLEDPLLAGEVRGDLPAGFEMNNSPAEMASRTDQHRPAVLVSSSGTPLMRNAARSGHGYVACLRNITATARHLARRHRRIAVVGGGSRGRHREEDDLCCARIAEALLDRGFHPGDEETAEVIRRWEGAAPDAWLESGSVGYLRSTGQERDIDFILAHYDDVDRAFVLRRGEVVDASDSEGERTSPPSEARSPVAAGAEH